MKKLCIALVALALVITAASAMGACDWPFDNKFDPARCASSCPVGFCQDGVCQDAAVVLPDKGVPDQGVPDSAQDASKDGPQQLEVCVFGKSTFDNCVLAH